MSDEQLCLTLIDTAGVQAYVFGSNRLRENVGGSEIVVQATDEWLYKAACAVCGSEHVEWRRIDDEPRIPGLLKGDGGEIALLYAGGGNTALVACSRDVARRVIEKWSLTLLTKAPGLRVAVAHEEIVGGLGEAWQRCQEKLQKAKDGEPPAQPLQGVSLTRSCRYTGLAAAGWEAAFADPEGGQGGTLAERRAHLALAPMAARRLEMADQAGERLKRLFPSFVFPERTGELGQREGESYLAVVHADGNGLGKQFHQLLERKSDAATLVLAIQQFASDVHRASRQALGAILDALAKHAVKLQRAGVLHATNGRLPFRPILFGGDDVTFVCHGKLGLGLAAYYLQQFARQELRDGTKLSACAGVAIVHTKAPFAQAYRLAEQLCSSAKRSNRTVGEGQESWLDAHLALSGIPADIKELRKARCMRISEGESPVFLDGRPWRIVPAKEDERDWQRFVELARYFTPVARMANGDRRGWPRSVLHELLDACSASKSAVDAVLQRQEARGRGLPVALRNDVFSSFVEGSNHWRVVRLYDALELSEYFTEVSS